MLQIERITSEKRENVDFDILSAVERDMMLIENQVPFIVLQTISEYLDSTLPIQGKALEFVRKIYSPNKNYEARVQENPRHLVDLLRLDMFGSQTSAKNPRGEARSHVMGTT